MDEIQMNDMLAEGYTPEYVSLVKWRELRKEVLNGNIFISGSIGSSTCALCKVNDPTTNGCNDCSLSKLLDTSAGYSCVKPWRRVNECRHNIHLLGAITNMVNHLQLLVAIYGVKKS